jgi:hypothetical protein
MRKFGAFPIVVNYNLHNQLRSNHTGDDLYRAGRREEEKRLYIKTSTTSDSVLENNLYKQEVDQYETTVSRCLQKIEGNPVGRMVLGLINKQTTVWIIPETDDMKKCSCAQTNPLDYVIQPGSVARGVGFGDTVIQFQPELGDDTLFHELVHAYRYSYKKFSPICIDVPNPVPKGSTCGSSEEFLAHQMENIYMSQANRPLTLDYYDASAGRKDEIYDFLVSHVDRLEALKYFLRHEYLAMLAAHSLAADYNPFRDYGMLEGKYLKDSSLSTLPELGTVLQP